MTSTVTPLEEALARVAGGDPRAFRALVELTRSHLLARALHIVKRRDLAEEVLGRLMAYDVDGQIGAGRYERNEERTTQRNGYRHRAFDTRLGTLDLKIPKLRKGAK